MADQYSQDDAPLDIFGSDPLGRNYLYGLRGNGDGLGLQPPAQGLPVDTRPYDRMQATPRGFISGLFSDVLGGALNMPNVQMTGVPALDLLYANRKPLMNFMGVGDFQKTAERISYGEPLTSGAGGLGGTSRPLPETVGAALTVAPFVGEAVNLGSRVGRAGARMVGERMAENVAMGRPNLPSMFAEPRASLFAVEPSPMMPKPQAPVSELGFYSATEQAALNLPRNKGTGQSFLNDLMKSPDVKKDELAWTGLDDFLKNKPNVTKQEVQDFIANNKVDLQEVRLGGNEQPSQDLLNWMSARNISPPRNPEGWQELSQKLESYAQQHQKAQGAPEASQRYFTLSEEAGRISEGLDAGGSSSGATKYQKYQLAGGENYREILLKLPQKETRTPNMIEYEKLGQQMFGGSLNPTERARLYELENLLSREERSMALSGGKSKTSVYQSSHFDEPNILAHIRVNDRVDADGKKMLLVEEIQSDWHQAGREKGYKGKGTLKELPDNYFVQEVKTIDGDTMYVVRDTSNPSVIINKDYNRQSAINGVINELNASSAGGVPDAPFKDTWYQLALKRVMKYAADNGYERVGLTTGKQQVDRYKMSNEVNSLAWRDAGGGVKRAVSIDLINGDNMTLSVNSEGKLIGGEFKDKSLSSVLGKDLAKKIMSEENGNLMGNGLNIGGEGMKAYYDEIYPKFLEKYGKKWDASVGETEIKTGQRIQLFGVGKIKTGNEKIRYIDITPKMKESVGKGQPLFTAIPAGTLGLGGLEYADPFASPLTEDTTR